MPNTIIAKLTLDDTRDIFQEAGYRVETVTDPVSNTELLRSTTSGLAFDIRPGNRDAGGADGFLDMALVAVLFVQGELPLEIVNRWNSTHRFGRLQLSQTFLVFTLDVSVAGGTTKRFARAQIEIWDRLVQELIAYLRDEVRKLPAPVTPKKDEQTAPSIADKTEVRAVADPVH